MTSYGRNGRASAPVPPSDRTVGAAAGPRWPRRRNAAGREGQDLGCRTGGSYQITSNVLSASDPTQRGETASPAGHGARARASAGARATPAAGRLERVAVRPLRCGTSGHVRVGPVGHGAIRGRSTGAPPSRRRTSMSSGIGTVRHRERAVVSAREHEQHPVVRPEVAHAAQARARARSRVSATTHAQAPAADRDARLAVAARTARRRRASRDRSAEPADAARRRRSAASTTVDDELTIPTPSDATTSRDAATRDRAAALGTRTRYWRRARARPRPPRRRGRAPRPSDRSCGTSRRSTGTCPARTSAPNRSTAVGGVALELGVAAHELRRRCRSSKPSRSWYTSTWPSQWRPAPMPIVGTATDVGDHAGHARRARTRARSRSSRPRRARPRRRRAPAPRRAPCPAP